MASPSKGIEIRHQVYLTAKAERDLEQILHWFHEQQAASAGNRWFRRYIAQIGSLEQNPSRYPLASESVELQFELRELSFGNRRGKYRILFVVQDKVVTILHVRHSARDAASSEDLT